MKVLGTKRKYGKAHNGFLIKLCRFELYALTDLCKTFQLLPYWWLMEPLILGWPKMQCTKLVKLPSQLIFPFHLSSWWKKCIESPKNLCLGMLRSFLASIHKGMTPTNDIFWTPLIVWKTQTNIGKQLCIYQCPTRHKLKTKTGTN